jgi:hypothetical protein
MQGEAIEIGEDMWRIHARKSACKMRLSYVCMSCNLNKLVLLLGGAGACNASVRVSKGYEAITIA